MTFHTRSRVDSTVDLVLIQIISPMRQGPLRGILVLVARLQFFLVRVAIGAERLFMADFAGPALLLGEEPVPRNIVRGMVQCRLSIGMAVAAFREPRHFNGMLRCDTGRVGAGVQAEEQRQPSQQNYLCLYLVHIKPLLWRRNGREA